MSLQPSGTARRMALTAKSRFGGIFIRRITCPDPTLISLMRSASLQRLVDVQVAESCRSNILFDATARRQLCTHLVTMGCRGPIVRSLRGELSRTMGNECTDSTARLAASVWAVYRNGHSHGLVTSTSSGGRANGGGRPLIDNHEKNNPMLDRDAVRFFWRSIAKISPPLLV